MRLTIFATLFMAMWATAPNCVAQIITEDANAPFGWAVCSSMTSGDDYKLTGGGVSTSDNTITLKANGTNDMRNAIRNAVDNYSIIILDGSDGAFVISKSVDIEKLTGKTIVGINNACLTTQFKITEGIRAALDAAGVKSKSTSSGTGGTLYKSDGVTSKGSVGEACELATRQTIINQTKDDNENYRKSGIFNVSGCENIIIRNITFEGPGSVDVGGYDLISQTNSKHIWVDHCEFIDGMDGNYDITNSSDFTTVSWCVFRYTERSYVHMNTNLVGSSDSEDAAYLNTTFANNIWGNGCDQRMPMARAGNIHLINNYYNCAGNSAAINPRKNSEFLIEGNYFESGVNKKFSASSDAISYQFVDNYNLSASGKGTTTVPYKYTKIAASKVPAVITLGAGATLADPLVIGDVSTPIDETESIDEVVGIEYYSIDGRRLNELKSGVVIVKRVLASGKSKCVKTIIK